MKKVAMISFAVLATVACVAWWFLLTQSSPQQTKTNGSVPQPDVGETQPRETVVKTGPETQSAEFNPYESEEIKANLQQIADAYEQTSKYPNNSQPVFDTASVREPAPFEENEVDLPFPEDEHEPSPVRVSAATNSFQYFSGDQIEIRVVISGAQSDDFVTVTGKLAGSRGDLPGELVFASRNNSNTELFATFDTQAAPAQLMTPEMLAKLSVTVGDRTLFTTTNFRYDSPSAVLVGLLPARVEGPNLTIPLQLNVAQSGYYFVRALLVDAQSNAPLVSLQQEGSLGVGNGLLNLSAHISALRFKESEGPYSLQNVKIYRGADVGETLDAPGSSLLPTYPVSGFPFTAYQDEEYLDEQAQERLDFLRGVASADSAEVQTRLSEQAAQQQLAEENPSLFPENEEDRDD